MNNAFGYSRLTLQVDHCHLDLVVELVKRLADVDRLNPGRFTNGLKVNLWTQFG